MRSAGKGWQEIADTHFNGDLGTASRAVKKFWTDQPKETVEEIRSAMLAKLEGLEQDVRKVMAKRHYVVAEGRTVQNHGSTCLRLPINGGESMCSCPKLIDDKPIYDGVESVRKLVETSIKLMPGVAAPTKTEVSITDDTLASEIERLRAELPDDDAPPAGDAGGTAAAEGAQG